MSEPTAEPVAEPAPVYVEPAPVYVAPEPVYVAPAPAPEPVYNLPPQTAVAVPGTYAANGDPSNAASKD